MGGPRGEGRPRAGRFPSSLTITHADPEIEIVPAEGTGRTFQTDGSSFVGRETPDGPLTSTAEWNQRRELVIETALPRGGTLLERWSLSEEGHLIVVRKRKGGRGASTGLKSVYRRSDAEIEGESVGGNSID